MGKIALAIALAAASAPGVQAPVSETVRLKFLEPLRLAQFLKLPAGVEQLTLNFKERSITVRGSRADVLTTVEQIFEADVEPVYYRLELRVVKRAATGDKAIEHLVNNSWASATADTQVTMSAEQDEATGENVSVRITPAGKGTVKLEVTMRLRDQAGNTVSSAAAERTIPLGSMVLLGGLTGAKDPALRAAVQKGERPHTDGAYTAYYIELGVSSPTEQKARPLH